jgi:hypothetical protein
MATTDPIHYVEVSICKILNLILKFKPKYIHIPNYLYRTGDPSLYWDLIDYVFNTNDEVDFYKRIEGTSNIIYHMSCVKCPIFEVGPDSEPPKLFVLDQKAFDCMINPILIKYK